MQQSIGQRLTPILEEIENTLWEFDAHVQAKPDYHPEALPASCKIFMSVLMDKMWELQEVEKIAMPDREKMAETLGNEIRKLVKTYTGGDPHNFYK